MMVDHATRPILGLASAGNGSAMTRPPAKNSCDDKFFIWRCQGGLMIIYLAA
jgi:hypothetical protein